MILGHVIVTSDSNILGWKSLVAMDTYFTWQPLIYLQYTEKCEDGSTEMIMPFDRAEKIRKLYRAKFVYLS